MIDLLDWIAHNGWAAFLIGCFICSLVGVIFNGATRFMRSITGHYPPPQQLCDSDNPCYCCRENGCQDGCRCYESDEEEGA